MRKTEKATGHARQHGKDGRFVSLGKTVEKPRPAAEEEKPLRPSQCRGHLRRELAKSFKGIVNGFLEKARDGSVQHLKLATELLEGPVSRRRGKGSAELLLETLRPGRVDEPDVWPE